MQLFRLRDNKLVEIKEQEIELEREMQRLIEQNIQNIFSLQFVSSELILNEFRIDTLAFDKQLKAFVILEYKKDKNFSVIDQGVAYMNLMLNNQAEFVLEYNEVTGERLERKDVDWSQCRIIFVCPEFNKYQHQVIGFKDLGIRLCQLKKYNDGTFILDEIRPIESGKSIAMIANRNPIAKKVSEVIKAYTEDQILNPASNKTKVMYQELKKQILELGQDIEVRPTKKYIAYRRNKGFAGLVILRNVLKIYLSIKKSDLDDPLQMARDVETIGHYSPGDTELTITSEREIPSVIKLIAQAYKNN